MSLDPKTTRRPAEVLRDKPPIDRVEHANIDRPGAFMHPRAQAPVRPSRGREWAHYLHGRTGWN